MTATAVDTVYEPEWRLLERLCLGIESAEGSREWDDLTSGELRWGIVLETAIRHRVLTMLANALISTGAAMPLRVEEHLRSVLACNRYRRTVWYTELGRVLAALAAADVPTAVRKGGAYESTIYHGDGRRWVGDMDLLIRPQDAEAAAGTLAGLGYEQGLYDEDAKVVVPFKRTELVKYRLNPDHLPTRCFRTGDPLVPVLEVDFATSLVWARAPYQVPVDDVLANLDTVAVPVQPAWAGSASASSTVSVPRARPEFLLLDTVLHLFREAWFEWWLDKEQDVDLMKFGDVLRLAAAYRDRLIGGRFRDLVLSYDVTRPVCWVLEHLDRTFGTTLVEEFDLAGNITEVFLASAAASGPDSAVWHADMRARLHAIDRRSLLTGR